MRRARKDEPSEIGYNTRCPRTLYAAGGSAAVSGTLPSHRLAVDILAISAAFDDDSFESHYYLDKRSGQVVKIPGAVRDTMERLYEELNSAGDENLRRFPDAVKRSSLPEEERQAVLQAHQVESQLGSRYITLPPAHPRRELKDMEDFACTVADAEARRRLEESLRAPHA